jgi:hypothetical protein
MTSSPAKVLDTSIGYENEVRASLSAEVSDSLEIYVSVVSKR